MEKPEGYPDIVYKYRDWNNGFHKNILLNDELYLASPRDFNDPFDCRIAENFFLLETEEDVKDYIDKATIKHFEYLNEQNIDLPKAISDLEKRLADRKTFQKENEQLLFERQDMHYGILSLSCRWNSILMWSHYAASHTGFCVGFHEEKLRNSGLFGKGGPVLYNTSFPEMKPTPDKTPATVAEKAFIETHTKSEDWTYEEEYRLVTTIFPKVPEPFERIVRIPDDFFAEVILGINMNDDNKRELIKLCQMKKIPICQAEKVPFKFDIKKVPIANT